MAWAALAVLVLGTIGLVGVRLLHHAAPVAPVMMAPGGDAAAPALPVVEPEAPAQPLTNGVARKKVARHKHLRSRHR